MISFWRRNDGWVGAWRQRSSRYIPGGLLHRRHLTFTTGHDGISLFLSLSDPHFCKKSWFSSSNCNFVKTRHFQIGDFPDLEEIIAQIMFFIWPLRAINQSVCTEDDRITKGNQEAGPICRWPRGECSAPRGGRVDYLQQLFIFSPSCEFDLWTDWLVDTWQMERLRKCWSSKWWKGGLRTF